MLNKLNIFIAFAVSATGLPLLAENMAPYVYTNGGTTSETLRECVSTAKRELRAAQFTRDFEVIYDDSNSHSASLFATHRFKPVSIGYRCMTNIATWTYVISSLDNDEAWDTYLNFHSVVNDLLD